MTVNEEVVAIDERHARLVEATPQHSPTSKQAAGNAPAKPPHCP
jgi:hypothetical protein